MRATFTAREGRIVNAVLSSKRNFDESHVRREGVHRSLEQQRHSDPIMSNFDHVYPTATVHRHMKGNAEKIKMQQPRMICNNIEVMGGVDLMDRLLSAYRLRIKCTMWWWNLLM